MTRSSKAILIGSGVFLIVGIGIVADKRGVKISQAPNDITRQNPRSDKRFGEYAQKASKDKTIKGFGKVPELPNELFKDGTLNPDVLQRARDLSLPEFEAYLEKIAALVKDERVFAEILWLILEPKTPKWKYARLPEAKTVSLADQVRICNRFVPGGTTRWFNVIFASNTKFPVIWKLTAVRHWKQCRLPPRGPPGIRNTFVRSARIFQACEEFSTRDNWRRSTPMLERTGVEPNPTMRAHFQVSIRHLPQ